MPNVRGTLTLALGKDLWFLRIWVLDIVFVSSLFCVV